MQELAGRLTAALENPRAYAKPAGQIGFALASTLIGLTVLGRPYCLADVIVVTAVTFLLIRRFG